MTYFCWLSCPHILFSELIFCTWQQRNRWSKNISCMEVICITWLRTHTLTQANPQEKWLLLSVTQPLFASSFHILLSCLVTEMELYSNDHLSHSLSSHRGHLSWFHIPEHLSALPPPSKGQSQLAHAALQSSAAPVWGAADHGGATAPASDVLSKSSTSAKLRFTSQCSTEQSRHTHGHSTGSASEILGNVRN